MPTKKDSSVSGSDDQQKTNAKDKYKLNDMILCRTNDRTGLFYEAKIKGVIEENGETIYQVHYQGWHRRHDEDIPESEVSDRFQEFTPENKEKAVQAANEAKKNAGKKKSTSKTTTTKVSGGKGGDDSSSKKDERTSSRASTPSVDRLLDSSRASVTSEPTASISSSRKRKSAAPEAHIEPPKEFGRRKEVRINIPDDLKQVLVDDGDLINRQYKLLRIPARVTAAAIIARYAEARAGRKDAQLLIESSLGIRDYFDNALGTQLLYKFERPQYADLVQQEKAQGRKEESEKLSMSQYYGFAHMLRLFVRFGSMLSYTNWSERSIQTIVQHVHDFIDFVQSHKSEFFSQEDDYETAPPDYQKRAFS